MSALLLPLYLAAAGFALIYQLRGVGGQPSAPQRLCKTLSTALLALAAWAGEAPWLITLGLALGAVGDHALARPGQRALLAGLVAFALGHLAYIAAFLWQSGLFVDPGPGLWLLIAALVVLPLTTPWWLLPWTGAMRGPVAVYAAIIAAMAISALLPAAAAPLRLTGIAGFVLSDLLLALRLFRLQDPKLQLTTARLLWPLYWGGQALILASALP